MLVDPLEPVEFAPLLEAGVADADDDANDDAVVVDEEEVVEIDTELITNPLLGSLGLVSAWTAGSECTMSLK